MNGQRTHDADRRAEPGVTRCAPARRACGFNNARGHLRVKSSEKMFQTFGSLALPGLARRPFPAKSGA